jgi:predicted dehydrogenase
MRYSFEYDKKLTVGFVGSGDFSYTTILPCFQYLPVDLVALADPDRERGLEVARRFGVRRFYPSIGAMLAKEEAIQAVYVVAGVDESGRPHYPQLASEVLVANRHVWVGGPPCANGDEIKTYTDACIKSAGKYVMAGFKRMFMPVYVKLDEIIKSPQFGGVSSFAMRYPLVLPSPQERLVAGKPSTAFLQFVEPYSLLVRLFGEARNVTVAASNAGDAVITFHYSNGLIGSLHCTGNMASTSPLERIEVVGKGANVIVENASRLIYYRSGSGRPGVPGRETTYIGADERAPILWEPEFSLGQLYNKQLFMQGYVDCLAYFANQLLAGESPKHGSLVNMLHIMNVHDKILSAAERQWISI